MKIFDLIKQCDSWSKVQTSDDARFARYFVRVHFDTEEDAKAFAEEILKITVSDPPYIGVS